MSKYEVLSIIGILLGCIGIYVADELFEIFATILMLSFSGLQFSRARYFYNIGDKTLGRLRMFLGVLILVIYLIFVVMYVIFYI